MRCFDTTALKPMFREPIRRRGYTGSAETGSAPVSIGMQSLRQYDAAINGPLSHEAAAKTANLHTDSLGAGQGSQGCLWRGA